MSKKLVATFENFLLCFSRRLKRTELWYLSN